MDRTDLTPSHSVEPDSAFEEPAASNPNTQVDMCQKLNDFYHHLVQILLDSADFVPKHDQYWWEEYENQIVSFEVECVTLKEKDGK